jgi:autoinducer 2-degrading protein
MPRLPYPNRLSTEYARSSDSWRCSGSMPCSAYSVDEVMIRTQESGNHKGDSMSLCRSVPFLFVLALGITVSSWSCPVRGQEEPNPIVAQVKASVKDPGKPFVMLVHLQIKEGANKQFEAAFARAIKATRKEKGNLAYVLHRDAKHSNHYLVYERWRNLEVLKAHLKTPHITTLLMELEKLLAGPPEVRVLLPAGG